MDVFDEELFRFWKSASENGLRYIMIGSVATNLHGYQRTTENIDLCIEDSLENRKLLRSVFKECGLGDIKELDSIQLFRDGHIFI